MRAQALASVSRADPQALATLVFPLDGSFGRGRPLCAGALRGRVYATLAPELEGALARWLGTLTVPEGRALKAPDVFRVGDLVVKFFTQPSLFGWVRAARAVRSAERHFWCQPLRSPRPLVAAGSGLGGASVLVREHLDGRLLSEVWGRDERAEEELARFLADMERHRIVHGDLHPRNLLWTGSTWVLLDADGLRHGLHVERRVRLGQWARLLVYLAEEERVERLFRRSAAGSGGARRVQWPAIRAQAARFAAERERAQARRPGPP